MPLHPVIAAALESAQGQVPYHALPLAQARLQAWAAYPARPQPVAVASVQDMTACHAGLQVPVRLYLPPGPGPHPALVFFHGSGFVLLDLDTHDDLCRRLCAGAGCAVVSVDYRLAPEHQFPAAPDDCLAATRWVAAHAARLQVDADRMVLAGDSAGACLAIVTALRLRDEGGPALRGQLLFYPVTDHCDAGHASYATYATGYGLSREGMQWFWCQYLSDPAASSHPHAVPMKSASLAGLPPAFVATAEYDVLRDEGEAYADRLRDEGLPVVLQRCYGLNHGFLKYAERIAEVDDVLTQACRWLSAVGAHHA